jgi:hypothetical protein
MKARIKLFLLLAGLLSVGCSTGKVVSFENEDVDASKIKTFALSRSESKDKLSADQRRMDSLMLGAIRKQMEFNGYEPSYTPDVFFGYKVVLNNSSESRVNQNSPYSQRYYYPYDNYNVTTYQYLEGVVIIDAVNAAGKLVWQGSKNFKAGKKVTTREILTQTVKEIIAVFPPRN